MYYSGFSDAIRTLSNTDIVRLKLVETVEHQCRSSVQQPRGYLLALGVLPLGNVVYDAGPGRALAFSLFPACPIARMCIYGIW